MPPKGAERSPSLLGNAQPHDAGWRVRAMISGRDVYGPYRTQKAEAERDLVHARSAQTQEEYYTILKQLHESKRSGGAHSAPHFEPSGRHSQSSHAAPMRSDSNGLHIATVPSGQGIHSQLPKARHAKRFATDANTTTSGGISQSAAPPSKRPRASAEASGSGEVPQTTASHGASCSVMVKSIDVPWCDDVAAGSKFFECVANRTQFTNQFKRLRAGDLFVVVRKKDRKRVTAVARVQSEQLQCQTDQSLLMQHLEPERHDAIRDFIGDAPSFNIVFFDQVYDCRNIQNFNLTTLTARVPGLQEPPSLNGPGFLTRSKEARDALLSFLHSAGCPLRCASVSNDRSNEAPD